MVTRQKRFEKWERTRSKGKWNFVLKYGVLFWGLGTAVLFSLFIPIVSRKESFLGVLPFALVVFSNWRYRVGNSSLAPFGKSISQTKDQYKLHNR